MPATWRFEHGASTHPGHAVSFRVWAPGAQEVAVRLGGRDGTLPLSRAPGGFHEAVALGVHEGTSYSFLLDGRGERPDPFSREQLGGPLGPSRVVDLPHDRWLDPAALRVGQGLRPSAIHDGRSLWTGEAAGGGDAPELRLGTRPGEAVRIGPVTEPVAGGGLPAALLAPARQAGGARWLRALVTACHRAGLAVLLRLPFDHLAEEAGFLLDFGPWLQRRPDGDGFRLDLRTPQVRSLAAEVMLAWLSEYRIDALELQAQPRWEGLDELDAELAARTAALGLPERPLRVLEGEVGHHPVTRPAPQAPAGAEERP